MPARTPAGSSHEDVAMQSNAERYCVKLVLPSMSWGTQAPCRRGHPMNVQKKAWSETHLLAYWVICTLEMLIGFAFFLVGSFTLTVVVAAWSRGMARRISTGSVAEDILVILGAAVSLVLGFMLLRYAAAQRLATRKRIAPDAITLMARDPRPPILYLRSFIDDTAEEPFRGDRVLAGTGAIGGLLVGLLGATDHAVLTQEERLAKILRRHGPFVAVSDPSDKLPDLGAARLSLGSEEWQSVVANLMTRSRLIVIRPGSGSGLWWEIERVLTLVPSSRVVFWLPGKARDGRDSTGVYSELRRVLGPRLPDQLPEWRAEAPFLCFSEDWRAPRFKKMPDLL